MQGQQIFTSSIKLGNSMTAKILKTFLFECPVPGVSVRGQNFDDLGWKGHYFSSLKAELLFCGSAHLRKNYKPVKKDQLLETFSQYAVTPTPDEYCVFMFNDEKRVIESLFRAIRNSFAHGSFQVTTANGRTTYYMENYDNYLKARLNLNEETLINWIQVLKRSPEDVKQGIRRRR